MNLVILDRDGVINYDSDAYIKSPAEWIPLPKSLQAISKLTAAGFTIAIATNQSGIGRGLYDEATLTKIHKKLLDYVETYGGKIDKIVFCPHHPDANCDCRKPKPGMLQQIATHYDCQLDNIPFIGDSFRDMQAAVSVNCRPMLVLTGYGNKSVLRKDEIPNLEVFDNLSAAVDQILKEQAKIH